MYFAGGFLSKDLRGLIIVEGMVEAEVIKSKLENFGIQAMLQFEPVGRLFGITMNGLGKVKILVNSKDLKRSQKLIVPEMEG